MRIPKLFSNAIRGMLIGFAEVIPGVSGGTVALVLGVYDRIIFSASEFVRGALSLVGLRRGSVANSHFKKVDLWLILPLLAGMGAALILGAKVLGPLLENYPELSRATFAGMIAVSLSIPWGLAGKWRAKDYLVAAFAAIAAVLLTSLPQAGTVEPSAVAIVGAAALAICALVLPGVSGSFLLLAMGMYAPTIAAVNERNFSYLGLFAIGAVLGLGGFVSLLQYLLANHHKATMVTMTGLMVGSLRALWPWQDDTRAFTQVTNPWGAAGLFAIGACIVLVVIFIERRFKARVQ